MLNNKSLIRILLSVLGFAIIINMGLYRYYIVENIVLKEAKLDADKFYNIYQMQIWQKRQGKLNFSNQSYEELVNDSEFVIYAKKSLEFFKINHSWATIYNPSGVKLLTSHKHDLFDQTATISWHRKITSFPDKLFLRKYYTGNSIPTNFNLSPQEVNSPIIRNYYSKSGTNKTFAVNFYPLYQEDSDNKKLAGILEVAINITEQWANIMFLEKSIFLTFICSMILFYCIIRYNSNYAQSILFQQYEINRTLEAAKNEAESESSAKTEFLANVSHELRTPLNAIIGFSEIILANAIANYDRDKYMEYVTDINNSGKHLLSLINDILDFSKATADKLKVNLIEVDVCKVASSSLRFVKIRADEAKIKLIEDIPSQPFLIQADPKRLKQALLNLLSNAVKFTPEGGEVILRVQLNEEKNIVYVKVIDNGIGMQDKDIPKALATFGQIDNKLSRKYEGTGLGLPLTKKLVELMNGTFEIQSEEGNGTNVILTFLYKTE